MPAKSGYSAANVYAGYENKSAREKRNQLLQFPRSHAFVIGINHYPDISAHLTSAVPDAERMAAVLWDEQGFDQVWLLRDIRGAEFRKFLEWIGKKGQGRMPSRIKPKAITGSTTPGDRKTIEDNPKNTIIRYAYSEEPIEISPDDSLLFYYAGHGKAGEFDQGPSGYLLPSDAKPSKAALQNKSLVPMDDLLTALQDAGCKHTFLILDCCFAGKFRYAVKKSRDTAQLELRPLYAERFERYKRKAAWQVLVSAGPDQTAADWMGDRADQTVATADGNKPHSPFALALFEALAGKAEVKPAGRGLGDGVLTASELKLYLYDQVEKKTQADAEFKAQYPDLFPMQGHLGGEFMFFDPNNPLNFPERKTRNPYKGLKAYDPEDADVFFGRKASVDAAFGYLKKGAVAMVISAPSGLGKSSFARAGLYPKLKNELRFEDLLQMRPGESPGTALDKLKKQVDPHKKQVLLIDQYEELFTVCTDESQRQDFESGLMQIFDDASKDKNKTRILITVRSDYEWRLENSELGKKLLESQGSHPALFRLAPMNLDQLREALVNPALMEAFEFESPQLVDRILQEISFAPGALPLLSLAMKWLFQGVQKIREETDADVRVFTTKHYEQLGGINQCLSKMADAVYEQFDEAHRDMMRNTLLRMVQLQESGLVRRRVYINPFTASQQETATHELDYPNDDQDRICRQVLKALEGSIPGDKLEGINLLLRGTDENGREYVEPAHDSLINYWPTCLEWIDEFGKDNLALQRQLWQGVLEHQKQGMPQTGEDGVEAQPRNVQGSSSLLWHTNPKLLQVIQFIMESAKTNVLNYLSEHQDDIFKKAIAQVAVEDREAFQADWEARTANGELPDLETTILSGYSENLLELALEKGDHWLNEAETAFVRLSWRERIKGILQLKKERDEAKAIALPVLARRLKDNAVALNLAMAAHRLHPNEGSSSVLIDFLNKPFCKTIFHGHNAAVSSVAFSPDGTSILTGSFDKTARLWNIKDQSFKSFAGHEEGVTSVAFSPDGKYILTGSEDKTVRLWNIKDQSFISFAGHEKGVTSVAFSPDGKYILTSSYDHTARLWSIKDQSFISFAGHEKVDTPAVFSQDGQSILTGSRLRGALLWNITGHLRSSYASEYPSMVRAVAFSPNGDSILAHHFSTALLWKIKSSSSLPFENFLPFEGHKHAITYLAFSPDGQSILTGSRDRTARLWNIKDQSFISFEGHEGPVNTVAFSPDGQYILTGSDDKTARLWKIWFFLQDEHEGQVNSITLSPDGQFILTGSDDKTVRLWNIKDRSFIPFTGHEDAVTSVAFSPKGQFILSGSKDHTARLWNIKDQSYIPFIGHEDAVTSVAFSPDGQYILTGSNDNTVRQWNLNGSGLPFFFMCTSPKSAVFSPNGELVLCTGSELATLYNEDGSFVVFDRHDGLISSIAFSPDGESILTGSWDRTARLWNIDDQSFIRFEGHEGPVLSVAFSPDGQYILTGSEDKTVRLWNIQGRLIQTFEGLKSPVISVAFSADDGQLVMIGCRDGTVMLRDNFFKQWETGAVWDNLYKLNEEERREYKITWDY